MDVINTYQTDERLMAFVSNYSDSGDSILHLTAKHGFSTGRHLAFLQILFDQYKNRCMYDSFNDYQRKEFEFLVEKYKLVRSEVYFL